MIAKFNLEIEAHSQASEAALLQHLEEIKHQIKSRLEYIADIHYNRKIYLSDDDVVPVPVDLEIRMEKIND